jgi:hypothetical protein
VIPLLRMRKITVSLVALSLFVAAPATASAAKGGPVKPPKPSKGFADGNTRFPTKGFADGNKGEPAA